MDILSLIKSNPNIEVIEIPLHTPEWYDFRLHGIGASEIGYVLRKSDWKDALPVFEEKVGLKKLPFSLNEHMTFGNYLEGTIADVWTYYNGEGYYRNINEGKRIRKCYTTELKNKYFRNKKYPWLFCSLDGLIAPGSERLDEGKLQGYGILEIKNQRSFALKKWESPVPIEQFYQIHQIMLILEADYGEIATFVDGWHLQVTPLPLIPKLAEDLLSESRKFWYEQVLPAKAIKRGLHRAYASQNFELATRLEAALYSYEPVAIGTPSYVEYLAESAQQNPVRLQQDKSIYDHALWMRKIDAMKKELDKKKMNHEAIIRSHFRRKEGTEMDFDELGTIRIKRRKNSEKAILYNYVEDRRGKEALKRDAFLAINQLKVA